MHIAEPLIQQFNSDCYCYFGYFAGVKLVLECPQREVEINRTKFKCIGKRSTYNFLPVS